MCACPRLGRIEVRTQNLFRFIFAVSSHEKVEGFNLAAQAAAQTSLRSSMRSTSTAALLEVVACPLYATSKFKQV